MSSIRVIKSGLLQLWSELQIEFARHRASDHRSTACCFPINGDYIVSTDRGLFRISENCIRRSATTPAFGLAIDGADIFIATWTRESTAVLKGRADALDTPHPFAWRDIYSQQVATSAGRLHQIAVFEDAVWLANTGQNCLTKIDRETGAWKANIAPMACGFAGPIWGDNNHINGVMPGPGYLVFSVFKINRRSAVGICGKGRISLFAYPNLGLHDCIVAGGELWFSDSYRSWEGKGGGAVLRGGRIVRQDWFDTHPQGFVRGIAGDRGEIVIGNSFVGSRESRFSGRAHLILIRDNTDAVTTVDLPASQIYEIVRRDGRHFDVPAAADYDSARASLEHALGPPTIEYGLDEMLVSPVGPKFDVRDRGAVEELA